MGIPILKIRRSRDSLIFNIPDSKIHVAYMGPTGGRQDPGGPHVGPMILAIWDGYPYTGKTTSLYWDGPQEPKQQSHSFEILEGLMIKCLIEHWKHNSPKRMLNFIVAKLRFSVTTMINVESFWNFAQSTSLPLRCPVQHCKTIRHLKNKLRVYKISQDWRLRWVLAYILYWNSLPFIGQHSCDSILCGLEIDIMWSSRVSTVIQHFTNNITHIFHASLCLINTYLRQQKHT